MANTKNRNSGSSRRTEDIVSKKNLRQIAEEAKAHKEAQKKLEDEVSQYKLKLELELKRKVSSEEERLDKERREKEYKEKIKDLESQIDYEYNQRKAKESALWDDVKDKAASVASDFSTQLDGYINKYVDSYQKLSAHLVGSGLTINSLTNHLSRVLSSNSLVKQEAVYDNLSKLISQGINFNVEQRAFLGAVANDLDLIFSEDSGSLPRLIRMQRTDITANRLSMMYTLQGFLNQNFQNSEYLRGTFQSISDSLIETQSLMSAQNAMALETTIQT